MGLTSGDVVLVYVSAPEQSLRLWFRIAEVEKLPVDEMWHRYHARLGIPHEDYRAYFEGAAEAVGLHVGELQALDPGVSLDEIRKLVPDFVPPQGIAWLRDEVGRFKLLLPRLSAPLPRDAFPRRASRSREPAPRPRDLTRGRTGPARRRRCRPVTERRVVAQG